MQPWIKILWVGNVKIDNKSNPNVIENFCAWLKLDSQVLMIVESLRMHYAFCDLPKWWKSKIASLRHKHASNL